MTSSKGGTLSLSGKTYNISQINSVYTGSVPRFTGGTVWGSWFVMGVLLSPVAAMSKWLWVLLTIAAFFVAGIYSSLRDYAVFFDMSSGRVAAYSDSSMENVERVKNDIVAGLEEGYFPNYLRKE